MGNAIFKKPLKVEGAPVVVVVGGGYAGVEIAKALDATMNVVLIERKDYFLHNIGSPRAFVHPEFAEAILIPYDKLLKNGQVIQATVEEIGDGGIKVAGSEQMIKKYDYLVICTGTAYAFPYKVPERTRTEVVPLYEAVAGKLKTAKNVVVVGGGPTGLEAAAEIAEEYPECKVFLVHAGDRILPGSQWKDKFVKKLTDQITAFPNIELILNDRVVPPDEEDSVETDDAIARKYAIPSDGLVATKNGRELPCDLLFWAIGGRINAKSYASTLPTNDQRMLKVEPTLQIQNHPTMFACGDCADCSGAAKTVNFATQTASTVVKNIKALHAGKPLTSFKPGPDLCVVQLGHKRGAGQIPTPFGPTVLGPGMVQSIKADMFAAKFWTALGYKKQPDVIAKDKRPVDQDKLKLVLGLDDADAAYLAQGPTSAEGHAQDTT